MAVNSTYNILQIRQEITRPANTTAYAAGDVVGGTVTVPAVVAPGYILRAFISTDQAVTPTLRIHLFDDSVTYTDNAAFSISYADSKKYLGYIDLPAMTNQRAEVQDILRPFQLKAGTQNLYFVVETTDAFTPTSEQNFHVQIDGELL